MLKYLKKYWYAAVLAPILMCIEVYGDLMVPKLVAEIIDNAVANGSTQLVYNIGWRLILITLLMLVGGVGCTIFSSIAGMGFGTEIRLDMFKKIQGYSFANTNKFKTSSLITRLTNDVVMLQTVVSMGLRMLIRAPLLLVGGIIMSTLINAKLALILAIALPILIIAIILTARKGFPLFEEVQKKTDRVTAVIRENLIGARVVKVFTREDLEQERFNAASFELKDTTTKAIFVILNMFPVVNIVMNFSILAVIWFGAKLIGVNGFEVGEITAFTTYITQILISLIMMTMVFLHLARSKASYDRVKEVLNEKPDIEDKNKDSNNEIKEGNIEFNKVSFAYKDSDGTPVIKDINLKIDKGELIAVLGSTGAGKTTLVNLISRMYDVTDGEVLIDNINVKDYSLKELRDNIGMVLQKNTLFSGTIAENIRWGKEDATDEEIEKVCEIAQISDFINALPDKYQTLIGQRGVNFSGGQKQRLCIARALIRNPKILILDDSMSALDSGTENRLRKAIKENMKNTTVIVIAQRINTAKTADRIVVLDKNIISGIGTHNDLLSNNEVYKEIYESQLEVNE
jgi:ATP-binding cassette subfamily B protein